MFLGMRNVQSAETLIWVLNPLTSDLEVSVVFLHSYYFPLQQTLQFLQLYLINPTPTISPTFLIPTLWPIASTTPTS